MGSTTSTIRFEKVVLNPDNLPILAKIYVGVLNKVLNFPKHVDIACVFFVSGINMYNIKKQKSK